MNEYLLTEFKRVSEVIPSILSSLNKDDNPGEDEGQGPAGGGGGRRVRRATVAGHEGSAVSSLATPQVRLDPDLKAFASKKAGESVRTMSYSSLKGVASEETGVSKLGRKSESVQPESHWQ